MNEAAKLLVDVVRALCDDLLTLDDEWGDLEYRVALALTAAEQRGRDQERAKWMQQPKEQQMSECEKKLRDFIDGMEFDGNGSRYIQREDVQSAHDWLTTALRVREIAALTALFTAAMADHAASAKNDGIAKNDELAWGYVLDATLLRNKLVDMVASLRGFDPSEVVAQIGGAL